MLSLISSALKGIVFIVASLLVLVGLAAIAIKVSDLYGASWWSKEQLDALFLIGRQAWSEAKGGLETLTWALAAFGLVVALGRLSTIARLISDFRESKGSIFELSTTITGVRSTVASLGGEVHRLTELAPTVTSTAEKLEDVLKQLADLQRIAVSENRISGPIEANASLDDAAEEDAHEQNWQKLREYWFSNGERLDAVIEAIGNARIRSRFRRMPRTDYPAIINALANEGWISNSARGLSLELHREFLSHRSRRRPVTDSIVGAAATRDRLLAQELERTAPASPGGGATPPGTRVPEEVV
jgi:hypothetical protein